MYAVPCHVSLATPAGDPFLPALGVGMVIPTEAETTLRLGLCHADTHPVVTPHIEGFPIPS